MKFSIHRYLNNSWLDIELKDGRRIGIPKLRNLFGIRTFKSVRPLQINIDVGDMQGDGTVRFYCHLFYRAFGLDVFYNVNHKWSPSFEWRLIPYKRTPGSD